MRVIPIVIVIAVLIALPVSAMRIESDAIEPMAACASTGYFGTDFKLRTSATQVGVGGSFTLSWCDPSWWGSDIGFSASRYDVYYSRAGSSYQYIGSINGFATTFRAESGDAGLTHRFFIRAQGSDNTIAGPRPSSRDSNSVAIAVVGSSCPAPGTANLTTSRSVVAPEEYFTLSWTSVLSTACNGAYTLFERRSTASQWTYVSAVPPGTTSMRVKVGSAAAGQTMIYYIQAANASGATGSNAVSVQISSGGGGGGGGTSCGSNVLCAIAGRFTITLSARDPRSGRTGSGVSTQLNDLFGYFSIPDLTGNPNNPEVFVKVLDAGGGKFWVFYGTMTDFELTINVQDKFTGRSRQYVRGGYNLCGGADTNAFSFPDDDPVLVPFDAQTFMSEAIAATSAEIEPHADCSTGLCMIGARFQVSLFATDPRTGKTAWGQRVQLNDLFGYFSLPGLTGNTSNPEVFVKVLDAGNGRFWVFYGGMTDFEYVVTVTDSYTGRVKTYRKAPYNLCGGADTAAF